MAFPAALGGTNSVGNQYFGTTPVPAPPAFDMKTFLQLITSELENQDPTQPMSNSEFAAQMAQLGSVEGINNLQQSSKVQEAASLMGKTVTAVAPATAGSFASIVNGKVTGLSVQNGVYYLTVTEANGGTVNVNTNSIQSVTD